MSNLNDQKTILKNLFEQTEEQLYIIDQRNFSDFQYIIFNLNAIK